MNPRLRGWGAPAAWGMATWLSGPAPVRSPWASWGRSRGRPWSSRVEGVREAGPSMTANGMPGVGLFSDGTYGPGLNGVEGKVRGALLRRRGTARRPGPGRGRLRGLRPRPVVPVLPVAGTGCRASGPAPQEEVDGMGVHGMGVNPASTTTACCCPLRPPGRCPASPSGWEGSDAGRGRQMR